jgi:hypothetical protein
MVDLASVHAERIDAGLREFILPVIVAFVDKDVVADLPGDNVELRPSGFR